ncbi:MAG: NAD(P)-binding protein [Anaerolineae bacterium]|nr:NAD(P)-binding protein [Anaerolineae bacterium]
MHVAIFTEKQFNTLTHICDTLIPRLTVEADEGGVYARCASDLDISTRMEAIIAQHVDPALIRELRLALDSLEIPAWNALASGVAGAFSALPLEERTAILRSWARSRFPVLRKLSQGLKRLAMLLYYSLPGIHGPNPNWPSLAFDPPKAAPTPAEPALYPLQIGGPTHLVCDVVVVGSGAGGSLVAAQLAAAGYDVIVLEKGGYPLPEMYDGSEYRGLQQLYEKSGYLTSHDLNVAMLAGSTLGGGTTINGCAAFLTAEHVLAEWTREFGLAEVANGRFQAAQASVAERLRVNSAGSLPNAQNARLEAGAQALGHSVEVIPRNAVGCVDCGFVTLAVAMVLSKAHCKPTCGMHTRLGRASWFAAKCNAYRSSKA